MPEHPTERQEEEVETTEITTVEGAMKFCRSQVEESIAAMQEARQRISDLEAEKERRQIAAFKRGVQFRDSTNAPLPSDDEIAAKLAALSEPQEPRHD